jgi:dipeptidyl aminopeptidase/acylaminoacyl peptidase
MKRLALCLGIAISVLFGVKRACMSNPSNEGRVLYEKQGKWFESRGTRCFGWLWLPDERGEPPPVVIMAHGFGAQMDFGLPAFAERFVEKGMAVFMFDYRNFGKSEGEPRNLVSPIKDTFRTGTPPLIL